MIFANGYGFLDLTELRLVMGDASDLWKDLADGNSISPTLFVRGSDVHQRHYLLSDRELNRLGDLAWEEFETTLDAVPPVAVIGREHRPRERSVVIDSGGHVTGAWVESEQVSTSLGLERPRRRRGPPTRGRADQADSSPRSDSSQRRRPTVRSSSTAGDPAVRRTPHLDSPSTIPTSPGAEFTISVYVDDQPFEGDEAGSDIFIDAPPEVSRIRVQVVLLVSGHFVNQGQNFHDFDIVRDEPRSRAVTFVLAVADEPSTDPVAVVTATFSYQGRPSGQVTKEWAWDPGRSVARTRTASAGKSRATRPARLVMYTDAKPVDLAVEILSHGNGLDFDCVVQASSEEGELDVSTAPYSLNQRAPEMVGNKLAAMRTVSATPYERSDALKRAGYTFWNAAPANFRRVFWQLIDAGRTLRSISIVSEEPCLPWELMTPLRPPQAGRSVVELPALGVSYAIGRWCRGADQDGSSRSLPAPPPTIPVTRAFVITPRYRNLRALNASAEVAIIRARMNGRRLRNASQQAFDTYFRRHAASALHFVCHGDSGVDDDDVLYLDNDQAMPSASVYSTEGLKAMCQRQAPFVFINACSTGAQVPGLTRGAGFPLAFGEVGARAIVAPLWPVNSTIASDIAVEIYQRALEENGPPLADILRDIRKRAYQEGGVDSYAAYAFYGDPHARLSLR